MGAGAAVASSGPKDERVSYTYIILTLLLEIKINDLV